MKKSVLRIRIFAFLGAMFLCSPAMAEEVIQFSLDVSSSEGVTLNGAAPTDDTIITQDNIDDLVFAEGAGMVVVNRATGIKYRVANSTDLLFLGNALGSNTNGIAIGRWVVGGGARSIERSSLISLDESESAFLPVATPSSPGS